MQSLQYVMTPFLFVSFLVSLAWVDFRYSIRRGQTHAEPRGILPNWLRRILYRRRTYQYLRPVGDQSPRPPRSPAAAAGEDDGYYHSKQRQLMQMETVEAFQIRSVVLVVLVVLGALTVWGFWRMAAFVLGVARAGLAGT